MSGLRIVGGKFGGRRLRAPSGSTTRPTVERVREALFNILGSAVLNAQVLDCYAGSGALGVEALSRGAASCVFVERSKQAADVLRSNLASLTLSAPVATVLQRPLEQSIPLLRPLGPFDLWLVDPPFALVRDGTFAKALSMLSLSQILSSDGLAVVEYPSDQPCPAILGLRTQSTRSYGDTHLAFLVPET